MSRRFEDVEFGEDLPEVTPDVSMPRVLAFTETAAMSFSRFTNHEAAKKEGLPGAIVPGQFMIAGMRTPPSQQVPLWPLRPPVVPP